MKNKFLSIFLALALCLTLLPTAAFADDIKVSTGEAAEKHTCDTDGHIDADGDKKCDYCSVAIVQSNTWINKYENEVNDSETGITTTETHIYGSGSWNLSADGTLTVLGDKSTGGTVTDKYDNKVTTEIDENGHAVTTVAGTTNATITTDGKDGKPVTTVVYAYEGIKITVTFTTDKNGSVGEPTVTVTDKDGKPFSGTTDTNTGKTTYTVTDKSDATKPVATVTVTVSDEKTIGDGKNVTLTVTKGTGENETSTGFTIITTADIGEDGEKNPISVNVRTQLKNGDTLIAKAATGVYTGDKAGAIADTTTTVTGKDNNNIATMIHGTGQLPDTIYAYERSDWYLYRDSVKKLVVGKGITAIGASNFSECKNLTTVILPEGLESIWGGAFANCTSLTEITLPASVTKIEEGAFDYCTGLTKINVAKGNTTFFSDGTALFAIRTVDTGVKNDKGDTITKEVLTLIAYPHGRTDDYTVPASLEIGGKVTLVEAIASDAFQTAVHLTTLTLPALLERFIDSSGMESTPYFYQCESLTAIKVDEKNKTYLDIDGVLFKKNDGNTTYTLICYPAGRTAELYTVPSKDGEGNNVTVTAIGPSAFQSALSLTGVSLPEGVETIGTDAFNASGLTEVNIPAGVTNLGGSDIGSGIYDGSAFASCQSLTAINVAEGNTTYKSIDGVLFKKNDDHTTYTLICYPGGKAGLYTVPSKDGEGHAVTAIGPRALEAAHSLTGVSVPEGVTTIGYQAFAGCVNLVSVFLPSTVTSIGAWAFERCDVLKVIYYAGSESAWQDITVTDSILWGLNSNFTELGAEYDKWREDHEGVSDDEFKPKLTNNGYILGRENNEPTFHYGADGTVTITLDLNGGLLPATAQTEWTTAHFEPAATPPTPTRGGYSFAGWTYTVKVFDLRTREVSTVTRVWNWADPVYADLELTARWSENSVTYGVNVPKTSENGTVKLSHRRAEKGETVTLTLTPDEGYEVESVTVLDKNGDALTLTDLGDGRFSFEMPKGDITVSVRFAPEKAVSEYFADVPANAYYSDAVLWAVKKGITGGMDATHFGPDLSCTRAQLAAFLYRYARSQGEGFTGAWMFRLPFTDVPEWCYEAVAWCYMNGIVQGYGDGLFGSEDAVTREQVVTILYRFAQFMGMDVSVGEDTNLLSYDDAFDVSEYAVAALQWAVGAGIVQGYDGKLMPQSSCTRAQIVTMLWRTLG